MPEARNDSELTHRFRSQSETALPRSPLHAALSAVFGDDPSLAALLDHAPADQQAPVLMLAALQFLILSSPDTELARWYPHHTKSPQPANDPALRGAVLDFVHHRTPELVELLRTRHVQTNEVGRCALFLPVFAMVCRETGPLAHVDIGTSAGLTTLLPQFSYRYDDGAKIGSGHPTIACSTRNQPPLPSAIPPVATAIGLDSHPLDITSDDDVRWLRACVWPDQRDRHEVLSEVIKLARAHPPRVVEGDAVARVAELIDAVAPAGHPLVTTSWVLSYLAPAERRSFMAELADAGHRRDISWLIAESPAQTPELPHHDDVRDQAITAISLVTWRAGKRTVRHIATAHPHGYWLHWDERPGKS